MMKEAEKKNLSVRFSFRMTEEESKTLEATAKRFNVKPSDVARMAVSAAAVVANQQIDFYLKGCRALLAD